MRTGRPRTDHPRGAARSCSPRSADRGYAVEDGLVTAGLASVGVPVLDHTGHPVAGISVTFEADRVDADRHDRLVSDVRRAATTLTRRLGG